MRLFFESLYFRYIQEAGVEIDEPDELYAGGYLISLAKTLYNRFSNIPLGMSKDDAIDYLSPFVLEFILSDIKKTLSKLGV